MADARSTDRIGNYTKFWDKDREGEKAEVQGARVDNYTEVVNGWYHSPRHIFRLTDFSSSHVCRLLRRCHRTV